MITVQSKPAARKAPLPPIEGASTVERMAYKMREMAFAGVTLCEIEKHKRPARDLATRQSIRRVS